MLMVGVGLDAIFQLVALRTLYPGEAVVVGFLLVAAPYQIIRIVAAWLALKSWRWEAAQPKGGPRLDAGTPLYGLLRPPPAY